MARCPAGAAYTSISFNRGGWEAYLANTFIPSLTDDTDGEHVNPYYSWDASVGYTFSASDPGVLSMVKGMKLEVGINDLFKPPSLRMISACSPRTTPTSGPTAPWGDSLTSKLVISSKIQIINIFRKLKRFHFSKRDGSRPRGCVSFLHWPQRRIGAIII